MINYKERRRIWLRSRVYLHWFWRQIKRWVKLLFYAIRDAANPETALIASSISYFTLISIFPMLLLSVAIASRWFDPLWAESEIVTQLEFVAPALGDLLGENIESIVRSRGPITGFSLIILLWSSSNVFNILTRAMDKIWGLEEPRPIWKQRGIAMLLVLFLSGLLLIASIAQGTVVTIVNALFPDELLALRPYTNELWAVFLSVLLFGELYRLLPHRTLTWLDVLPGAIAAGIIWDLLKRGFLAFINVYLSRSNLVYGSVATIFVFLTWANFSSIVFIFGAHLNKVYVNSRG